MGFKKIEKRRGFAELALSSSMERNRSLQTLEKMDKAIDWKRVEKVLMRHYSTGLRKEGADAYPPIMLFKCLLLQKWFRIPSDPELESQINDRISFKSFLRLPFDMPSADHSTFSRFRKRLSEDALTQVNSEVLKQFAEKGLSINEGIAIDARLVESASRPISGEQLKELREKRQTDKGKTDKNGQPLKFSRDVESDWVIRDDIVHFGLKEHASVDVKNGFILATTMTPASCSSPAAKAISGVEMRSVCERISVAIPVPTQCFQKSTRSNLSGARCRGRSPLRTTMVIERFLTASNRPTHSTMGGSDCAWRSG